MGKRKRNKEEKEEEGDDFSELTKEEESKQTKSLSKRRKRRTKNGLTIFSLPNEILLNIFSFLDPFSLCKAKQVNRSWNKLGNEDFLWEQNLEHYIAIYSWASSLKHQLMTKKPNDSSWKEYFLFIAKNHCIDCGKETKSKLLGNISAPFCSECREGYAIRRPNQNFIPRSKAKIDFSLNENELKQLKYGFCTNPMNAQWAPMNLFWKSQIERIATRKFHGLDKMKKLQKERRFKREISSV